MLGSNGPAGLYRSIQILDGYPDFAKLLLHLTDHLLQPGEVARGPLNLLGQVRQGSRSDGSHTPFKLMGQPPGCLRVPRPMAFCRSSSITGVLAINSRQILS